MAVLVGKPAPDFSADAVVEGGEFVEGFSISQFKGNKNVIFFFYPLDFTFVCPTELLAFQDKLAEFEKRDTAVIGCSIDSKFSHWAWLNTPQDQGGIQGVTYPLVSDLSKTIAMDYDVLGGEYDYEVDEQGRESMSFNGFPATHRGLFFIDKEGIVQHQLVNSDPLGRNIDEALRIVDAWRHFEEKGNVCPANWTEGEKSMEASAEGVASYLAAR